MIRDWTGDVRSVYATIGASNHSLETRQSDDYYATEPLAIDKLLTVETPYSVVWECACGAGHLSERLKEKGFTVISSDLVNRGYEGTIIQDFLTSNPPPERCDIITNPPYKYAKEFVLKALELVQTGQKVYMLLKLTFLEGKSRREELFDKHPPKTIYVFSERIDCAKNGDFEHYKGGALAYGWYVWQKGYTGDTVVKWI